MLLRWGLLLGLFQAVVWGAVPTPVFEELGTSLKPIIPLEEGWQEPPRMAQTRCWWWWLNGNVTEAALTRDLEEMKAKGLGGANIIDAGGADQWGNRQVPHGPDFASPQWCRLFVHAVHEADRLGLELGFNIVSGWNMGGPMVTPEMASKTLTFAESTVEGGQLLRMQLPQPQMRDDFYREVAVVAFPVSQRQDLPRIADWRQKAYYEYPGPYSAPPAWHLLNTADSNGPQACCHLTEVLDLTNKMDSHGRLRWQAPAGQWKVLRFGYTITDARVSTHSEGWSGRAIDYLDHDAFHFYWQKVVTPILTEVKPYLGRSLRFLHTDSWELGPVNWTPTLPQAFQDLHGYAMTSYLPALAGYVVENRQVSTRFLNDFRATLAHLIAENNYTVFAQTAHAWDLGIHPESGGPHAGPFDALQNLGRSDMPMGEFWARSRTHRVRDEERLFVKQTSSAAHIYGKRIALAEAFTTIGPQWERDPRMLKPVFDRVACEGHNLTMLHTFDCSPASMGLPGQDYFAGTHINPRVTWWNQAGAFIHYLNRCQFLLQQGLPVSDVLYFYGENIPAFVRLKKEDPAGVGPGYDYDVINREALLTRVAVQDGDIVLPDGTRYRLLVLPAYDAISLKSLRKIAALVDAGATVVGRRPRHPLGLDGYPACDQTFQQLTERLWGQGLVLGPQPARQVLEAKGIDPDFSYNSAEPQTKLDYIHRRTDQADIYFVVNRNPSRAQAECFFRVAGKQPELWTPLTGQRLPARAFRQEHGRTVVPLDLEPEETVFVIFQKSIASDATGTGQRNRPVLSPVQTLMVPWTVQFDPNWGPAQPQVFPELNSWTEHADPLVKYFSGHAVYQTTFDCNTVLESGYRLALDLGVVKNLAQVRLNGRDLGTVWTVPFRVDITDCVKPRDNRLEVTVVNLWPNRLIGDQQLPPEQRRTYTNITKFKKDSPLLPSGLLGPVRILSGID